MNWTAKQLRDIEDVRAGRITQQDLERKYGLPVAIAMMVTADES